MGVNVFGLGRLLSPIERVRERDYCPPWGGGQYLFANAVSLQIREVVEPLKHQPPPNPLPKGEL